MIDPTVKTHGKGGNCGSKVFCRWTTGDRCLFTTVMIFLRRQLEECEWGVSERLEMSVQMKMSSWDHLHTPPEVLTYNRGNHWSLYIWKDNESSFDIE